MLDYLKIFAISAIPLLEQRLSIPLGIIGYKLNPSIVFLLGILGSLIPAPFILLLFNTIFSMMKKIKFLNGFTNFIEKKIQKNTQKFEKYKEIGLIAFIGIPLPTTGVWTGTAVAAVLGLDFKKSMFCALIGAIISAVLLTILSLVAPYFLETIGIHLDKISI